MLIPESLRKDILEALHYVQQGIGKRKKKEEKKKTRSSGSKIQCSGMARKPRHREARQGMPHVPEKHAFSDLRDTSTPWYPIWTNANTGCRPVPVRQRRLSDRSRLLQRVFYYQTTVKPLYKHSLSQPDVTSSQNTVFQRS